MTKAKEDRILVVDDEDTVRSVLYQVLTGDGHTVESAANGLQALEIMGKKSFSLVITDIKMPGMTGLELLEKVKSLYSDTQVIIITSHASLETAISAMRHGAYDYLFKPFEDLDLISAAASRALEKIALTRENRSLVLSLEQKNNELERANHILKDLACRDGLTRLYNHRYFQDVIHNEILTPFSGSGSLQAFQRHPWASGRRSPASQARRDTVESDEAFGHCCPLRR